MLKIRKNYVLDENQNPIAVQIPLAEFERIEEIIENHGLARLMDEVQDEACLPNEPEKGHGEQCADLIGSLRHKVEIRGDIFSTGIQWEPDAQS